MRVPPYAERIFEANRMVREIYPEDEELTDSISIRVIAWKRFL